MNQQIAIKREQQVVSKVNILVMISQEDKPYAAKLGPMFASANVRLYDGMVDSLYVMAAQMKERGIYRVVTTRIDVLFKLLPPGRVKKANIDNYVGSVIPFDGLEFLIIPPLKQLVTVEYAEWMINHLITKFTKEDSWRKTSEFRWWALTSVPEFKDALEQLAACDLISVDCETVKNPRPAIELVQYTGFNFTTGESWTYVVPMDNLSALQFMRQANALMIPKVLQNGKYDSAYFFSYNAPLNCYYHDLKNAMHSQYAELPKDLAFSSALWLRDIMYWKDLSSSGDRQDKFRYGALDTWATGEAYISWLQQAPQWAKQNYVTEFSLTPALHMCEMTGIKRDMKALYKAAEEGEAELEKKLQTCRKLVGTPKFNPSSPLQCVKLICVLTGKKWVPDTKKVKDMTWQEQKDRQNADKKEIARVSYMHPLNERVLGSIIDYRTLRKQLSTYLTTGEKEKEFKDRILYSLNQDGTDTGRLASKEHHFWCGLNIQNMDGDKKIKQTFVADPGFHFAEADYEQAEDRGVAVKSGDPTLLDIFEQGVDSHSFKASMFFGIPYEEIYRDPVPEYIDELGNFHPAVKAKKLNVEIRDLAKRVNHGANYNMGESVLLETMGPKNVREAQRLLKLPAKLTLIEVCRYLLICYERAFPTVKKDYYRDIKLIIKRNKMLVSDTGWTRYCFGNPETSKQALNKYVAHVTQNLNAMILNKAFMAIYMKFRFNPNFKLLAQIHDSILFQYRIGHEYLLDEVKELMTFPVPVKDCKGITRELIVPVDVKKLGVNWAGTNE